MSFILNDQQQYVVDEAYKWWRYSSEQVFQFTGYAGVGKSVVLYAILDRLNIPLHRVAPMAYIGQAAIIMRLNGLYNAKTIHSWLFNPVQKYKLDKDGKIIINTYFNRPEFELGFESKPLEDIDLIIIDEAGSVPASLKHEILSRGKKIIATGDKGQLPPVFGESAFLNDGRILEITKIMRQDKDSALLYLADRARKGLPINTGYYGDCLVITEDELTDQMLIASDIIICGKNKTREIFNNRIRHDILKINSKLPVYGEKLICRKNNWTIELDGINLANGLIGTVVNSPSVENFYKDSFRLDFKPNMLNNAFINLQCDYQYLNAPYSKKDMLKNNKYNKSEKFEYAYAISTHLSQGAQFNKGIYYEEFLSKDIQCNLNYTGITRFRNSMIYVKPKRKYY